MKAKEHKAWDTDMVSCVKHYEVNNDKCHNYYWLVKVRIWTGRNTFFRRRFVVWFDSEDIYEHYEGQVRITQADVKEYAKELAWGFMDNLPHKGEVTYNTLQPFTEECNETIRHFNRIAA